MASFDSVNYSLRPSKSVQRGLVFEGLRAISNVIDLGSEPIKLLVFGLSH